jgi:hypothetical protein
MKCKKKVGLLDKEETPNSELDFVAASIKHKITQNCITKRTLITPLLLVMPKKAH